MKKTILVISIVVIGLFLLWTSFLWRVFNCGFAGSYPCVETWDLKIPEKDLIKIINEIKHEHPELQLPEDLGYTDGRSKNWDSTELVQPVDWNSMSPQYSYWYYINFYYSDTKEIVHTWIRTDSDSSITTLALDCFEPYKKKPIQMIDSLNIKYRTKEEAGIKEINRDFNYFENKKQIWKFENKVLDVIKQKIKRGYK